jgi:hypothetical protein
VIYTVLISRNLSSVEGVPNGKLVGRVVQICSGDCCGDWDLADKMKEIFYWKDVDITTEQHEEIEKYLNSPIKDEQDVVLTPRTNVDLNCFSSGELEALSERGPVDPGLGGQLTFSNFIFTEV